MVVRHEGILETAAAVAVLSCACTTGTKWFTSKRYFDTLETESRKLLEEEHRASVFRRRDDIQENITKKRRAFHIPTWWNILKWFENRKVSRAPWISDMTDVSIETHFLNVNCPGLNYTDGWSFWRKFFFRVASANIPRNERLRCRGIVWEHKISKLLDTNHVAQEYLHRVFFPFINESISYEILLTSRKL